MTNISAFCRLLIIIIIIISYFLLCINYTRPEKQNKDTNFKSLETIHLCRIRIPHLLRLFRRLIHWSAALDSLWNRQHRLRRLLLARVPGLLVPKRPWRAGRGGSRCWCSVSWIYVGHSFPSFSFSTLLRSQVKTSLVCLFSFSFLSIHQSKWTQLK